MSWPQKTGATYTSASEVGAFTIIWLLQHHLCNPGIMQSADYLPKVCIHALYSAIHEHGLHKTMNMDWTNPCFVNHTFLTQFYNTIQECTFVLFGLFVLIIISKVLLNYHRQTITVHIERGQKSNNNFLHSELFSTQKLMFVVVATLT